MSPLGFVFQVKKLPTVSFFCQDVEIPEISLQPVATSNPFVKIHHTGDHIDYQPLDISFKVDEDLVNYKELLNWIVGEGFPHNFNEYKALKDAPKGSGEGLKSDVSVHLLTSDRNPKWSFVFHNAFPTQIGRLSLKSTDGDVNYISCTARFVYTTFRLQNIKDPEGPL